MAGTMVEPAPTTGAGRFSITRNARPVPADERAQLLADLGFGRVYTDHMVTLRWSPGRGWHAGALTPYRPLRLDPAAMVLHYGQAIFEGLKAYRQAGGGVALFRPDRNARRFNASAARLAMPELPADLFTEAVRLLVRTDLDWVPSRPGQSLYLRPLMIATEASLGVRPAEEYLFVLLASPVDPFFSRTVTPVRVWVTDRYVRAAPGGTGEAKCGGNYAAALLAQAEASAHGCDQVVWLDARERRLVEELNGMNLFFVRRTGTGTEVLTPRLTGSLLPGITRDSLLTLAADQGFAVREGDVRVDEWRKECADGTITEVFACGTAAVVAPVGEACTADGGWRVGSGTAGPVTLALRERLLAIQHGQAPDPYGWMTSL
jgi:branched-chain amino acid aminotransferase